MMINAHGSRNPLGRIVAYAEIGSRRVGSHRGHERLAFHFESQPVITLGNIVPSEYARLLARTRNRNAKDRLLGHDVRCWKRCNKGCYRQHRAQSRGPTLLKLHRPFSGTLLRFADNPSNWITSEWPTIHELAGAASIVPKADLLSSSLPFPHRVLPLKTRSKLSES